MDINMNNVETALSRSVVLFFLAALLFSVRAIASDDLNQYGLGSDGMTLPAEKRSLEKLSNFQFIKDFENDYKQYAHKKTLNKKKQQDLNKSVLQINVEYEDTEADFSSPFHGFNSALNNKLNNTSN